MSTISDSIRARREDILRIAAQHGARNVCVFGSVARGDAGPESDLDLLVDAGPETTPFFPGGMVADLEQLLGRRIDVVEPDGLLPALRDRVLCEAVPL
jgi:predicted nucleotidyltransferase